MANKVGAPLGNKNRETHGIVTFQNTVKKRTKRGRSFIDRRSASGQNALEIRNGLLQDLGGDRVTTAQRVIVELVVRDVWLLDEIDTRIGRYIKKVPQVRNNPRAVATLNGYRAPIAASISRNLQALGLKQETPFDLFADLPPNTNTTEDDNDE